MPLPGRESHFKMTPAFRRQELEQLDNQLENARKAAVLSLFYPDQDQQTRFLLILRKTYTGVHSNQVGFPGGKFEPEDHDLEITALRETEEEIGLPANHVKLIRSLSPVYIPPSNFWVAPFLGICPLPTPFIADPLEVEQIIEVPLSELLNDHNLSFSRITTSYARDVEIPVFLFGNFTVWGATAMMLNELKELIKTSI